MGYEPRPLNDRFYCWPVQDVRDQEVVSFALIEPGYLVKVMFAQDGAMTGQAVFDCIGDQGVMPNGDLTVATGGAAGLVTSNDVEEGATEQEAQYCESWITFTCDGVPSALQSGALVAVIRSDGGAGV